MNVNTSGAPGVPTTVQRTNGGSTRVAATDDGGADGAGAAKFLSMLQALSTTEPEPELALAAASGAPAKTTAMATAAAKAAAAGKAASTATGAAAGTATGAAAGTATGAASAIATDKAAAIATDKAAATATGKAAATATGKAAATATGKAAAAGMAGQGADAAIDADGLLEDEDVSAVAALVVSTAATDQRLPDAAAARPQQAMSQATRLRPAGSSADATAGLPDGDEVATRAAAETSTALADTSTALASKSAVAAQSNGDALARQAAASVQADRDADMSTELAAAGDADDADGETPLPRPLMAALAGASAAPVVSMFEAGLAGLRGATGGRMGERQHARHAISVAEGGFVPWTDAMPTGTSHGASPVYAPGATTPAPQAALAQKVHYWVSRGVQSAELQLDAFGGGSVKVHIAVKGDEAVVEFRTDQPQARKLLQDAMPQLQAMLAEEGLNLSGGFVGSSAQQRSGSNAQSGHLPHAQRADGHVATVHAAVPGATARAASGAAVDLFV